MRIQQLNVTNLRGLKSISLSKATDVNVIVGPNATGKSTILEAIRLTKTILSPRIGNETQHTLQQMGILNPSSQAVGGLGLDISSIANEPNKIVSITLKIQLDEKEIAKLRGLPGPLALALLQSEISSSSAEGSINFTQYLSSTLGRKRYSELLSEVNSRLNGFGENTSIDLEMTLDPLHQGIHGNDNFSQSILAILDRNLPTHKTLFSLFPADRAFAQGDQQIQIGNADVQQQLLSHISQPSLKYARLKQTIIHNVLLGRDGRGTLEREFNLIFDNLLPGKKLHGVGLNDLGLLKILVLDQRTGKAFDIDHMSSGEKGLVLTFLFLRLSVQEGGVVLLDEPELHLNSAVQAKIIPFLLEHCIKAKNLQAFVCTHSPEIVRDSFEEKSCSLFHLRAGDDLTPVHKQDYQELFEVFGRLGSSAADVLFTRGNIYVEGEHDSAILQSGFSELLNGYKIDCVGGREAIEKEAPLLQAQETAGRLKKLQLFLLDNDRKPSRLKSTTLVRVHQLKRYCIENYLVNEDFLFDLIKSHARKEVSSRGQFPAILEELALSQITEIAIWETYSAMKLGPEGLRRREFENKNFADVAETLSAQMEAAKERLNNFSPAAWKQDFMSTCDRIRATHEENWKTNWREVCSGKTLIDDLYIKYEIGIKKIEFKKDLMKRMAAEKTDEWRALYQIIESELHAK